jgi:hypothetical protein
MAGGRTLKPWGSDEAVWEICTVEGPALPDSHPYQPPGSVGRERLTEEEQELLLDLLQLSLDLVGIIEPTPFADGTNVGISLYRKDLLGAALSGLGIIPYLGDLAKVGKLPRYVQKLERAIDLAKVNPAFRARFEPLARSLQDLLASIPTEKLAAQIQGWIDTLRRPLDRFLGPPAARHISQLDVLTDRLLLARMGSTLHVGKMVRENVRTVAEFLTRYRVPEDRMLQVLNGIDLHSPVRVVKLRKGDRISQAVGPDGNVGSWFVRSGGGTGKESSGISGVRKVMHFEVTQPVDVLQSRAADTVDFWSKGLVGQVRKADTNVMLDPVTGRIITDVVSGNAKVHARRLPRASEKPNADFARGGGQQLFLPPMTRGARSDLREYNSQRWRIYLKQVVPPKP